MMKLKHAINYVNAHCDLSETCQEFTYWFNCLTLLNQWKKQGKKHLNLDDLKQLNLKAKLLKNP